MTWFLSLILLVAGFILLKKGADWLIEHSSSIARRWGIPALIVGLTVVAFGTSLPELAVSLFGALFGSPDISVGTVVGSNIMNIALILGLTAAIAPLAIKERTLIYEFPFVIVSALFLLILSNDNNIFGINTFTLGRFDGTVLLLVFAIFFIYIYSFYKNRNTEAKKEFEMEYKKIGKLWHNFVFILLGIVALFVGGRILVFSAVDIATIMGLSEKVIGLTIVALGTSLPELFTSITAMLKQESGIAVGNIIGSNIFNILWVIGLVAVIKPLSVNPQIVYFDMVIMLVFSLLLVLFATTGKKLVRWEGAAFLAGYVAYVAYLFILK